MNAHSNPSPEEPASPDQKSEAAPTTGRRPASVGRREFLKGAAASATVLPLAMGAAGLQASPGRPNVVYLFSDEHRYQSMSFTETPAVRTPNMARLADEGASFEYAISNNPVCNSKLLSARTGPLCWAVTPVEHERAIMAKTDIP